MRGVRPSDEIDEEWWDIPVPLVWLICVFVSMCAHVAYTHSVWLNAVFFSQATVVQTAYCDFNYVYLSSYASSQVPDSRDS